MVGMIARAARPFALVAALAAAGAGLPACHVTVRLDDLRPGKTEHVTHRDRAHTLAPALEVTGDGRLRFVVPLACPTTDIVEMQHSTVVERRPNLATFVVGVILTSLGGVGTGLAIGEGHPARHPLSYVSPVALAAGLVFAIGPFVGNRRDRVYGGVDRVVRGEGEARCGEQPLSARSAVVLWHGIRMVGTIDGDGYYSRSPYEIVNTFAAGRGPDLDVGTDVELAAGHAAIQAVVPARALIAGKAAYLRGLGIDAGYQPLRKVPRVEPVRIAVSRTTRDGRPILRVSLELTNTGPGAAWQVRGVIGCDQPEVDGRMIYVGKVPPGGTVGPELEVPLSAGADRALAGSKLHLTVTLADADQTVSDSPIVFDGEILNDVPR
jgi:hypothetical protein